MEWFNTVVKGLARPLKWWVVIAVWERGLRVRLGKNPTVLEPGLHLRIPWLDRIYVQSVRLRTIDKKNMDAMTSDGGCVVISTATSFSVRDIRQLYDSLATPEQTINAVVQDTIVRYLIVRPRAMVDAVAVSEQVTGVLRARCFDWGLENVSVAVTGITICRAYRLLSNDYMGGVGLGWLDGGSSERK